jgi:hypothetical protein
VKPPARALLAVIDASGAAAAVEALLPSGPRERQLPVRTLLLGMMMTQDDGRPAHLTAVHAQLAALPRRDRRRLGVLAGREDRGHELTYRQVEGTFATVAEALARDVPGGLPSPELQAACDRLLEASVPAAFRHASTSLAVDWTDLESFSRPPPKDAPHACAAPEAWWGHRKDNLMHDDDEMFFGWYLSAAGMVPDEGGPPVPEFCRRLTLCSCRCDPVPAFTPVLAALPAAGIPLGDVLADSGYAFRLPVNWAAPLRAAGARLVQDTHPRDRGPKGTHQGAVIANGNLYCPAAPRSLLELGPLPWTADAEKTAAHDRQTAEAARWKLGRHTADDADGYHRAACPAAAGKVRCPLRPESMTPGRGGRPEVLQPPEHPPACCTQATVTVPPGVLAKTAQKHDYPGAAWRASFARRTGVERLNSTVKDRAACDTRRGWCRLMGLVPNMLFAAVAAVVRNQRILAAWNARQADAARRAARGLPPKTRKRRRKAGDAAEPPRKRIRDRSTDRARKHTREWGETRAAALAATRARTRAGTPP